MAGCRGGDRAIGWTTGHKTKPSRSERLTAIVGPMVDRTRRAPHADTLEAALPHFNDAFRQRYRLPTVTIESLRQVPELDDELANLATVRADGVTDASCALIARVVLSLVPRYAIGVVDGSGRIRVDAPDRGDEAAYRGHHVLLVNPIGGPDNWSSVARWVREVAGNNARRAELAGLASERRPDQPANLALLKRAAATHGRAVVLPPDEGFSAERAAEVSYIYGVPVETLRAWKQRNRAARAGKRPGAPPKNR